MRLPACLVAKVARVGARVLRGGWRAQDGCGASCSRLVLAAWFDSV